MPLPFNFFTHKKTKKVTTQQNCISPHFNFSFNSPHLLYKPYLPSIAYPPHNYLLQPSATHNRSQNPTNTPSVSLISSYTFFLFFTTNFKPLKWPLKMKRLEEEQNTKKQTYSVFPMDSLSLFCTGALLAGGLYWFVCVLGPAERKGKRASDLSGGSISAEKVQDSYKQYWSFFRRPKEIETAEKVPDFVDTFYNLVTDIYEWGWGPSFHFSPSISGGAV